MQTIKKQAPGACHTDRQTDRQTDRKIDRETDRQIDRQTRRLTDRKTSETEVWPYRKASRQTERQRQWVSEAKLYWGGGVRDWRRTRRCKKENCLKNYGHDQPAYVSNPVSLEIGEGVIATETDCAQQSHRSPPTPSSSPSWLKNYCHVLLSPTHTRTSSLPRALSFPRSPSRSPPFPPKPSCTHLHVNTNTKIDTKYLAHMCDMSRDMSRDMSNVSRCLVHTSHVKDLICVTCDMWNPSCVWHVTKLICVTCDMWKTSCVWLHMSDPIPPRHYDNYDKSWQLWQVSFICTWVVHMYMCRWYGHGIFVDMYMSITSVMHLFICTWV